MNDYGFGNYLYEKRKAAGLSQNEMAEKLGVTGKAVSKWETGAAKPRTNVLRNLSALLNVPVEELLKKREREKQLKFSSLYIEVCVFVLLNASP